MHHVIAGLALIAWTLCQATGTELLSWDQELPETGLSAHPS